MSDYISREKALAAFNSTSAGLAAQSIIENIPAAKIQIVKHAKWKQPKGEWPSCSRCGHRPRWISAERGEVERYDLPDYCPRCGSKMDQPPAKDINVPTTPYAGQGATFDEPMKGE